MVFPKNSRWNTIFLVLSGKIIFLFPENMILPPDRKWKMIFLKKSTRKYDIFFKCSEKMVFSKRIAPGHDLSCTIWKGGTFFRKTWYFFPGRKNRKKEMVFPKKYTETWYFLFDMFHAPLPKKKKNQRWFYHAKIHPKVADILDRHPRKGSSNSVCFHGRLYRSFYILLSTKKKQETEYIGLKFDFFFNLFS